MIPERLEENACLYVLGALSPEESREFEAALRDNKELQTLVVGLRDTSAALAGNIPAVEPSPDLRRRILAQAGQPAKIVPLPAARPEPVARILWLPWAIAACLAILCAVIHRNYVDTQSRTVAQARQINELNQAVASLRAQTNDLQRAVLALRENNRLAGVRIALLNSLLADSPKAVAVSLWDNDRQSGVFVVQNLKRLPADRDYQLWVIDPKYQTPVDAGVFQVDESGNVRVEFHAKHPISVANKFAVTEERKGGVDVPTLKNLALIGS